VDNSMAAAAAAAAAHRGCGGDGLAALLHYNTHCELQ
jgi:hypothetical protein